MTEGVAGSAVDEKDDRIVWTASPKMDFLRKAIDAHDELFIYFHVLILSFLRGIALTNAKERPRLRLGHGFELNSDRVDGFVDVLSVIGGHVMLRDLLNALDEGVGVNFTKNRLAIRALQEVDAAIIETENRCDAFGHMDEFIGDVYDFADAT